jgi:ParB family chromosome partitioning protein
MKRPGLGRGLDVLLPQTDEILQTVVRDINIDEIDPNTDQPRKEFDEQALEELSQSIKQQGVIAPITVRKMSDNRYQLIAGERRFRASKMAGLAEIPAYIRVATDAQVMEMALVENIQRENLNALEIALSYNALIEECNLTQEQLSEKVGKNRSTVTNYLRLLKLPAEVQVALSANRISMAHARAIINIEDADTQLMILHEIIQKDLSVRQVETMVKTIVEPKKAVAKSKSDLPQLHQDTKKELHDYIQSEVEIKRSRKGKGTITITFNSDSDFQRIISLIKK